MTRLRTLAALVVILTFLGGAAFALSLDPVQPEPPPVAIRPVTTTTSEPDIEPLVKPLSIDALADVESELSYLSEPSTTTTTLPPSTTTAPVKEETSPPQTAPPKKSPPKTSPPTTAAPSTQAGFLPGAESEFASSINSFRSGNGLSGLSRSGSLDSYARSWAKKMAQSGSLSHSNIGSLLGKWTAVAENVGTGGSVGSIFGALKGSSGHRANMLGDYTHMGIGVWRDANGVLWTAHVFTR